MGRPKHQPNDKLVTMLAQLEMSQSDLAAAFGISRQAVNFWCRQGVPADRVFAVAEFFGCSPRALRPDLGTDSYV